MTVAELKQQLSIVPDDYEVVLPGEVSLRAARYVEMVGVRRLFGETDQNSRDRVMFRAGDEKEMPRIYAAIIY